MMIRVVRVAFIDARKLYACCSQQYRKFSSDGGIEKEKDFTQRIKDLPENERFGDFSKKFSVVTDTIDIQEKMTNLDPDDIEDEKLIHDIENHTRLSPIHAPHDRQYYEDKMRNLIESGDYDDAKTVFYSDMLEKFRVKPTTYICNFVMRAHAALGEAEDARNLLKLMLSHRISPNLMSFGLAFTAYTHCNDREFAHNAAEKLYNYIKRIELTLDSEVYSRVIKCFSRDGNVHMMMSALDDMLLLGKLRPDGRVLIYLLQGCAVDQDVGAGLALQVWHRFNQIKRFPFSERHFVLLLNCICKCNLGDVKQLTATFSQYNEDFDDSFPLAANLKANDVISISDKQNSEVTTTEFNHNHIYSSPINLLSNKPLNLDPSALHQYLSHFEGEKRRRNIALVGGIKGYLQQLEIEGVKVNQFIVTTILSQFGEDEAIRKLLFDIIDKFDLKKDLRFYNTLIARTKDYEKKKAIISEMKENNIEPDVVSYGALGKAAISSKNVDEYLETMKLEGKSPNLYIFKQLYQQLGNRYTAKKMILQSMKNSSVHPDPEMIEMIENDIHDFQSLWLKLENGEEVPEFVHLDHTRYSYLMFVGYYKRWLKNMPLETLSSE